MMPKGNPRPVAKPPSRSVSARIRRVCRAIAFAPLAWLLLERLYVPFEFESVSSYLHVETTAVTTKAKIPRLDSSKPPPPLSELTSTPFLKKKSCQSKTQFVSNVELEASTRPNEGDRKIPKIVHQTSKTRCLTKSFEKLSSKWKLKGWNYYFHDDGAVNKLLLTHFPEFPHLQSVLRNCVINPTIRADIWRYLVLYIYGGVYADVDTAPNEFHAETIANGDDAFFVVEQYHILSQWFMAVSPKHPLMFYAIQHSLANLMAEEDTWKVGAHVKTGPHALHKAFQDFRRDAGVMVEPLGPGFKPVSQGLFNGTNGRSITVRGVGENENQYVQRQAIDQITKKKDYHTMGMTHFSTFTKPSAKKSGLTCFDAMLKDTLAAAAYF